MVLGAITGVPTPACLSAASNPVEAVTPPLLRTGSNLALGTQRTDVIIAGHSAAFSRSTFIQSPRSMEARIWAGVRPFLVWW